MNPNTSEFISPSDVRKLIFPPSNEFPTFDQSNVPSILCSPYATRCLPNFRLSNPTPTSLFISTNASEKSRVSNAPLAFVAVKLTVSSGAVDVTALPVLPKIRES